jgi:hypothetical protein
LKYIPQSFVEAVEADIAPELTWGELKLALEKYFSYLQPSFKSDIPSKFSIHEQLPASKRIISRREAKPKASMADLYSDGDLDLDLDFSDTDFSPEALADVFEQEVSEDLKIKITTPQEPILVSCLDDWFRTLDERNDDIFVSEMSSPFSYEKSVHESAYTP